MKPAFCFALFALILSSALAQPAEKIIQGTVNDGQNDPLPGATVGLYRTADSTLVGGEMTKSNGKFAFVGLVNSVYYLRISSMGYATYYSGSLTVDAQHPSLVLPAILLRPSQTTLKEVKVVAKKPLLEQEIDRTIVNVDAMIGSAGSNTLEVLEKTPGITVGMNGEISLNGKSGVLVLIDGRPTYLSGSDLAAYLRSLPGGSLDKLELMTNPPAKYDAAGTAVINIRLKRNRVQGITGDLSTAYSQGKTARSNNAFNLNYNRRKINLFGSLGYNKDGNYTNEDFNRIFYQEAGGIRSSVQLQNRSAYTSQGLTTRLGMDYAVSPKTTYGFVLNFQSRPRSEKFDYVSKNFNALAVLDSVWMGNTTSDFSWKNRGANLNFLHRFNQAGRELTAEANYINYRSDGNQRLTNSILSPDENLIRQTDFLYDLPSDITIYAATVDYTHPFANKGVWETGFKTSLVNTDNDSKFYSILGSTTVPDYGKSNHFVYRETINAAYVNTRKDWKRIGFQLGFRLENTVANGRQLGNAEVDVSAFRKNYTRLFPTAFLRYKLDTVGKNSLTVSMARRINRPNYQLLNPFLFFRDTYTYTAGNPLLNPQYHYQYELKYQHKSLLGIALQYNRFTDVIFQMTEVMDTVFITRPNNVAKGFIFALIANLSVAPAKWWQLNVNGTLARMALDGVAYSENLNPGITNLRFTVLNQFRLKKGWSIESIAFYSSKSLSGQTITDARYRVNTGVQKKIFKDRGSLRLTVDDVFFSWRQNDRTISLKQAEALHTSWSDTRRIGLAFTYRFGNETFARKRRQTNQAAETEKGRVD